MNAAPARTAESLATLDNLQRNFVNGIFRVIAHNPPYLQQVRRQRDREYYAAEFATIRLSLPRRMGNTMIARTLFQWDENTILIVQSSEMKRRFLERLPSSERTAASSRIFSIRSQDSARSRRASLLIADLVPFSYNNAAMERIYSYWADFYVLLG